MVYSVTDSSSLEDVKERYQSMLDATVLISIKEYLNNSLLIVLSITKVVFNLQRQLINFQASTAQNSKPVLFIGNKCDLDNDRVISKEQAGQVAQELGGGKIGLHETSAKNNIMVTEVRFAIIDRV